MGFITVGSSGGQAISIVIQDRSRLFRESLALVLESSDALCVVGTVADDDGLRSLCLDTPVEAAVFEADGVPWDVRELVSDVNRHVVRSAMVGTCRERSDHIHRIIPEIGLLPRASAGHLFVSLILGQAVDEVPPSRLPSRGAGTLTQRELQVLALISGGSTTPQIADRLGISVKTVENRRQSLFAKLGVQNQSHAVAVAMRTGLLRPSPTRHGHR